MKTGQLTLRAILGIVLLSPCGYSEPSQAIFIPNHKIIKHDCPPSAETIIHLANALAKNDHAISVYVVQKQKKEGLIVDAKPLLGEKDVGITFSEHSLRFQFDKNIIATVNDELEQRNPPGHPPRVVIAYRNALFFSPYVMPPIAETMRLNIPHWIPWKTIDEPVARQFEGTNRNVIVETAD